MSTRSIIAQPDGDGFTGRYCHWDGYPECRAAQLFETYRELGSAEALRWYAIRPDLTGYWSSFQVPSDYAEQLAKPLMVICDLCEGTGDRTARDLMLGRQTFQPGHCNGCSDTGQAQNRDRLQGWVTTTDDHLLTSSGDDMGTEWAYVIGDEALTVFDRRWGAPDTAGGKMVGMFGQGADAGEGYWSLVGSYRWDQAEPDWEHLTEAAYA